VGWPTTKLTIPVIPLFLAPPIFPFDPYPPVYYGFFSEGLDTLPPAGPIMNPAVSNQPPQLWNFPQPGSHDRNTPFRLQQTPIPTPVLQDEYPPVILLRTGGAYSVTKYWIEKENLYFVTTQGDSWYVPLSLIDHIYPRQRQGHISPE
jgi:hypothetical protein